MSNRVKCAKCYSSLSLLWSLFAFILLSKMSRKTVTTTVISVTEWWHLLTYRFGLCPFSAVQHPVHQLVPVVVGFCWVRTRRLRSWNRDWIPFCVVVYMGDLCRVYLCRCKSLSVEKVQLLFVSVWLFISWKFQSNRTEREREGETSQLRVERTVARR